MRGRKAVAAIGLIAVLSGVTACGSDADDAAETTVKRLETELADPSLYAARAADVPRLTQELDAARNEIAAGNAAQQEAQEYRAADAARKAAEDEAIVDEAAAEEARVIAEEEATAAEDARVAAEEADRVAKEAEARAEEAARAVEESAQPEAPEAPSVDAAADAAAEAAAAEEAARAEQAEQERLDRQRREAEEAAAAAEAAREAARQAEVEAQERRAAQERAEQEAAERATREAEAQAFRDAATAAAVAAAAAIIASAQTDHTSLDNPYPSVTDEDTAPAPIAPIQNPEPVTPADPAEDTSAPEASESSESSGSTESTQTTAESDTSLSTGPVLDTLEDISEQAAAEIAPIGDRAAQIEAVIARAESQIGVPYAWGGGNASGPTRGIRDGGIADSYGDYNKIGFDCSGLVLYAFAGVGIALPHYTGYQYNHGTKIDPSQMQRGDLIFYGPSGNHHVAIYLGDGMMLEAPNSGSTVQKAPVRWSGMSPYAVRLI